MPSADSIDVLFKIKDDWVGVEVKSRISDKADVMRGLFQCVKYKALIDAEQVIRSLPHNARAILALEGGLPQELLAYKNMLQVEVVEDVRVPTSK